MPYARNFVYSEYLFAYGGVSIREKRQRRVRNLFN